MQFREVPIDAIHTDHGRWHMRLLMNAAKLNALAASIGTRGLVHPLVVVPALPPRVGYDLVAGARRLLGCAMHGWSTVPVIIRDYSDAEAAQARLAENRNREVDKSALERAWEVVDLLELREREGLPSSQAALARELGRSEAAVSHSRSIGEAFPRQVIEETANEIGVPFEELLSLPQSSLIEALTPAADGRTAELLRIAAGAHVSGTSATKAVEQALGHPSRPSKVAKGGSTERFKWTDVPRRVAVTAIRLATLLLRRTASTFSKSIKNRFILHLLKIIHAIFVQALKTFQLLLATFVSLKRRAGEG